MAKPDLDGGYIRMAHELLAAVLTAHTPHEARVVLFEVFSQVYGPAKLRAATLRPVEIARRTGLKPSNVSRGIAFLLEHGMLLREGLNAYLFVKDYDAWKGAGKPVLTPQLSAYAAHASRLAQSYGYAKSTQAEARNRIGDDIKSTAACVPEALADADLISAESLNRIVPDTAPPISENRELQLLHQRQGGGGVDRIVSRPNPGPPEAVPAPPARVELRRPFVPDPAELARIVAWVSEHLGADNLAIPGIGYAKVQFPLDWIEAAIIEALAVPDMRPDGVWRYASRCLVTWWDAGSRPKPVPRPVAPAARPGSTGSPASPPVALTPQQLRKHAQLAALHNSGQGAGKERP